MDFIKIKNTAEAKGWCANINCEVHGVYIFPVIIIDNYTCIFCNEDKEVWKEHFEFITIEEFSKETNMEISLIEYI